MKKKIFIGVQELCGVASGYTKGLRALGYNADFVTYHIPKFKYSYDKYMDIKGLFPNFHRLNTISIWIKLIINALRVVFKYDCFIFLFGASLLPRNYDLPILKALNKQIIMVFLGCDIRTRYHKLLEDENCLLCKECTNNCDEVFKKNKVEYIEKYVDFIFAQQEYAQILTKNFYYVYVPIDTDFWYPVENINNDVPVIVHIPSDPILKGTKYIVEAVEKLKAEGFKLDFRLLENITNEEVKINLQQADIVIDQILQGWHGVLSIEAMSLAKPTVCYLKDIYLEKTPEIPLVNANKDNIYDVLKFLIENKTERISIGQKSRDYVLKKHAIKTAVKDFINILEL